MDNLVAQPEKVLEIDSLVDLDYDYKQKEIIKKGVIERNMYVLASDSLSNTNVVFQNIAPPSLTTVTDRCFRVRYTLLSTVTFADNSAVGTYPFPNAIVGAGVARAFPAGAAAYVAGTPAIDVPNPGAAGVGNAGVNGYGYTMALRSFPLNSCLTTLDLKLNSNSVSIAQNDIICLQPYMMDEDDLKYFECPVQRDNSALYSANSSSANRNPFNPFNQNSAVPSRGSYVATLIYENVAANVVTRVYSWDIVEPLIISPLVWGKCFDAQGLANIVNITIQLRIQDIQRSVSVATSALAPNGTSCTMSLQPINAPLNAGNTTMDLLLNYNTQDPVLAAKMATTLFYDYDLVQIDANSNAIANQGAGLNNASPDGQFNGNALRLSTIPDKIYCYIKPSKSAFVGEACQTIPDTFLRIKQLKVQFQNRSNLLSSFTEYDLWRMSVKNGLKMSWHEWYNTNGSIVIIDTVSDLGLSSDEAAGENKYNQIKIDGLYSCSPLTYAGQATAQKFDVMTVVITAGQAVVSPNTVKFETGGVDSTQVLALTTMKDNVVASGFRNKFSSHGGSLFKNTGKFLTKGLDFLKSNPDYVQKGIDLAQQGLQHLGVGGSVVGGDVSAGRLRKHKRVL